MSDTPQIVTTEPMTYASIALKIPVATIRQVMLPTLTEVRAAVDAQHAAAPGAWFTHHLTRPTMSFDFEVGVPTASLIEPAGRVQGHVWESMKVARTVYQGDYSGLVPAWGELERWIAARSYKPGTDFWERYLVNPEDSSNSTDWRTELNWPLLD